MPNIKKEPILTGEHSQNHELYGINSVIDQKEEVDIKDEPEKDLYAHNINISNIDKITRHSLKPKLPFQHPLTARIKYPHTAIGSFIHAFRDFINYSVYNDFKGIIFGAYNKSIQRYLQRQRYEDDTDNNLPDLGLPLFSYSLSIEGTDDKIDSPWRSTTFFPGLSKSVYKPFYEDEDCRLSVVYRRLKGSINANIYCSSQAQSLDIQMAFFDAFRGLNVYNQTDIRAMTILPDHLLFTDLEGKQISKMLTSNKITKAFIPAINETHYYIYNNTSALINMASLSEGSSYFSSNPTPEFTLNGSFNFEIDVPQYVLCIAKPNVIGIELNMDISYKYEDKRVLNTLNFITGDYIGDSPFEDGYGMHKHIHFQNGSIIDNKIIKINQDTLTKIPISTQIFPKNKRSWSYLNEDIKILIIFPGGLLKAPEDTSAIEYDENGDLIVKMDLFNIEDYIEIFVFKVKSKYDE